VRLSSLEASRSQNSKSIETCATIREGRLCLRWSGTRASLAPVRWTVVHRRCIDDRGHAKRMDHAAQQNTCDWILGVGTGRTTETHPELHSKPRYGQADSTSPPVPLASILRAPWVCSPSITYSDFPVQPSVRIHGCPLTQCSATGSRTHQPTRFSLYALRP
jgi:hypothetical protein